MVLLRIRMAEVGIQAETADDLLNKAQAISARNKELQMQSAKLEEQVTNI